MKLLNTSAKPRDRSAQSWEDGNPSNQDGIQELPIPNEEDFALFEEVKATNPSRLDTGLGKYCKHPLG